jgi:hypothetical protein
MAMQCNFHRLQVIVFINNSSYTQAKEIKLARLLWLDSPDELGTSCPRDRLIMSLIRCLMQDWSTQQPHRRYAFIPHSHAVRVIKHLVPNNQNKSDREGEYLPPLQVSL